VYYQQQNVKAKAKTLANQNALQTAQMETNANAIRGIFISRAFATAGEESSIAAILLSGFKWKVNETWLSILPIAILILLLRRRRSLQLGKYIAHININSLLEVIL
jgi:hypothetical protein